jgi:hypothetical protein
MLPKVGLLLPCADRAAAIEIGLYAPEKPHALLTEYVIVEEPAAKPVTIPDVPTEAFELLLLQLPPGEPDDTSVIVAPTDTDVGPLNVPAFGIAVTVTVFLVLQPVALRVNDMFAVPAATPTTMPVVVPTVAKLTLPLLHVPEPLESDNVIVEPVQTFDGPLIGSGLEIIVTVVVAIQPVPSLYVMVATPVVIPFTTPDVGLLRVAIVVLLLLHVPPEVGFAKVVVPPGHTVSVPVIAEGNGLTVMFTAL